MSTPLDPSLPETLPAELRTAVEARIEALAAERAARLHLDAEVADLRSRNAELVALNARLEHLAREMKRARFGPRSEKLNPARLEPAFEDLGAAMAETRRPVTSRPWPGRRPAPRVGPARPGRSRKSFRARSG